MENKEQLDQVAGNDNHNQDENAKSVENTDHNMEEKVDNNTETPAPDQMVDEKPQEETTTSESIATEELKNSDQAEEEHDELPEFSEEELKEKGREELVLLLEDIVRTDDVAKMKAKVAQVRVAFNQKTAEEKQVHEGEVSEEGTEGETEEKIVHDELDIRFNSAFGIYKEKKGKYNEEQEQLKLANLEKKKQLLEDLKELINSEESLKSTYDKFNEIQDEWKNLGMVPRTEVNNLWQNYHFLVEKFFDKVRINKELKDLGLKRNLEQKLALCEQAEELLLENSVHKSFKALQNLHKDWREIGPVPKDKKDEIWDRFKSATDKINQRRREHFNSLRDDQQENYDAKIKLCEQAETILQIETQSVKEWHDNKNKMQDLLTSWKTVGPAPKKLNDEVWERFKSSLDTFYSNKKEFFAKLKDDQMDNLNMKIDLCVQAESLKGSTDWKSTTRDLIHLQEEWKKIGPVPRRNADKIWKRFRSACDEFFDAKEEFFKNIHQHEDKNLAMKKELIENIKAFNLSEDKNQNLDALKDFQRKWMEVGHVPFADKDKIQSEYRSAIDSKFEELNISNMEKSAMNFKTKMEQVKDSPNADRTLYRERNFLQNKLNKLIDDIKLWENNIGFLADSKNANILKIEFEKKIKKAKQEIDSLKTKIKYIDDMDE